MSYKHGLKNKIKICPVCNNQFIAKKDCRTNNQIYCSFNCHVKHRTGGDPIFIKCKYCQKKFRISPSRIGKKNFCSKKCYSIWLKKQIERIELKCTYCNKHFTKTKKRIKQYNYKNHFCSHLCLHKYMREHIYEWRNDSKKEHNPAWKGGISNSPYSFNFNEELRELIRKRDNYKCQICGCKSKKYSHKLSIHHIDYNKQNDNPKNLIALCSSCHHKTTFFREKWIKILSNYNE